MLARYLQDIRQIVEFLSLIFNPFHATDLFWYPLKTSEVTIFVLFLFSLVNSCFSSSLGKQRLLYPRRNTERIPRFGHGSQGMVVKISLWLFVVTQIRPQRPINQNTSLNLLVKLIPHKKVNLDREGIYKNDSKLMYYLIKYY